MLGVLGRFSYLPLTTHLTTTLYYVTSGKVLASMGKEGEKWKVLGQECKKDTRLSTYLGIFFTFDTPIYSMVICNATRIMLIGQLKKWKDSREEHMRLVWFWKPRFHDPMLFSSWDMTGYVTLLMDRIRLGPLHQEPSSAGGTSCDIWCADVTKRWISTG